ncbi:hypothetical protein CE91St51_01380 [[Clostridium] innocuum]|nr:hypothetical protein CE91St51_01380 [[Clostridium] innocuum]
MNTTQYELSQASAITVEGCMRLHKKRHLLRAFNPLEVVFFLSYPQCYLQIVMILAFNAFAAS